MGLFDRVLRKLPGNPVSAAKTLLKAYNSHMASNPDIDKKDAFRYCLESRYLILKTMKQHEIEECLEYCDDLGEIVFWAIAKENPIAANQPHVQDTVNDLYSYFITVAPEESNGLKELMESTELGMDVFPFP